MLPSPSSQKQSQIASFEIRCNVISLAFTAACEVQLIILILPMQKSEVLRGWVIYSKPQSWEVELGFKFSQTDFQETSFALFMLWVNQFLRKGKRPLENPLKSSIGTGPVVACCPLRSTVINILIRAAMITHPRPLTGLLIVPHRRKRWGGPLDLHPRYQPLISHSFLS